MLVKLHQVADHAGAGIYVRASDIEEIGEQATNSESCYVKVKDRTYYVSELADVVAARINHALDAERARINDTPAAAPLSDDGPWQRVFKNVLPLAAFTSVSRLRRIQRLVPIIGHSFEVDLAEVDYIVELPHGASAVTFRDGSTKNVSHEFSALKAWIERACPPGSNDKTRAANADMRTYGNPGEKIGKDFDFKHRQAVFFDRTHKPCSVDATHISLVEECPTGCVMAMRDGSQKSVRDSFETVVRWLLSFKLGSDDVGARYTGPVTAKEWATPAAKVPEPVNVTVNNRSAAQVTSKTGPDGLVIIEIEDAIAKNLARGGRIGSGGGGGAPGPSGATGGTISSGGGDGASGRFGVMGEACGSDGVVHREEKKGFDRFEQRAILLNIEASVLALFNTVAAGMYANSISHGTGLALQSNIRDLHTQVASALAKP